MASRFLVPWFPAGAGETEPPAGHLHLLNKSATAATAQIAGRDRTGAAGANVFTSNSIPAHGSIRITAGHLEGGGEAGTSNGLGNGRGVWSLTVTSTADLAVVAFEGAAPNLKPLPVETLPPLPPTPPAPPPPPPPEPIPTGPAKVEIRHFKIRKNFARSQYDYSATIRNAGGETLREILVEPQFFFRQTGPWYEIRRAHRRFHDVPPGARHEVRGSIYHRGVRPGPTLRLRVWFDVDGTGFGPVHIETIDVPRMYDYSGRAVRP